MTAMKNSMLCVKHLRFIANQQSRTMSSLSVTEPIFPNRTIPFNPLKIPTKKAWIEDLAQVESNKVGLVDLHPEIFGVLPRMDVLYQNTYWQETYKKIDYRWVYNRMEMPGSNRKPWPQKGTGRARQGSRKAPHFHKTGGMAHGPRGPRSYFFMLPYTLRVLGLRNALTCKFAQDNLFIVKDLALPTDDPLFLHDLVEERGWGVSVLFVTKDDVIPEEAAIALDGIPQFNVLPVYGLNVHSILYHETLVLTLEALECIEERLLFHMNKTDFKHRYIDRLNPED